MLNLIAVFCVPLTLFFSVCNFMEDHRLLAGINLANSAASAMVLLLHHRRQYNAGRLVLLAFNFVLFAIGCLLYQNGATYYLLCVLIVTILVYDKKWIQILAGASIIGVILVVTFYPQQLLHKEALSTERNMINMIGALVFMTFIISFFKHVQYGYQAMIEEQHAKLKQMNADMQKIFSIVSHDIKSPLASLQSVIMLFKEGFLTTDATTQSIQLVSKRIVQLNSTLDNLLHWSSNNLKGLHTSKSHINLMGVVQETCYFLEALADQKAIDLDIQVDQEIFVYADRDQLSMILRNLISNAIKFSYAGGTVTLRGVIKEDHVTIQVSDTGVGMRGDHGKALFLSLQAPAFGTDGERGSGVGLMLCHELIKQNGGNIFVESAEGEGSTFSMTLPIGVSNRPTVLVGDDDMLVK